MFDRAVVTDALSNQSPSGSLFTQDVVLRVGDDERAVFSASICMVGWADCPVACWPFVTFACVAMGFSSLFTWIC